MKSLLARFVKDQSGATAIEYGLIAAGIAVVVITLFSTGGSVDDLLTGIFDKIYTSAKVAKPA
jgi:pilus assembly protein Flp/PilA